ncbi:protein kinase domain-containing protein [Pendulispora albinea]|uniref:Protein kinase n=1 Tax=Pendulispora albinea TaxID=2741071 RepID=A0ABZ2MC75_9BACT
MTHPAPAPLSASVTLAHGTVVFGRYVLDEVLGEGGMGTVWAARHTVTRKPVALKFLKRKGAEHAHRFLREARIVSALKHPNVVQVYDVLQFDDDTPVMVMDRLFGESLGARLKRDRTLPLPEVASIALQVADVVGAAHQQGVVHRDLKPENIFLSREPPDSRRPYDCVKVLDFGIAKLTAMDGDAAQTAVLTVTGDLMGTPYYMAPEQVFGERAMDHRADIWSLGVILYECLSGKRPFEGENVGQVLKGITLGAIAPLESLRPDLPEELTALVGRMLARDPEARPKSLADVAIVFAPLAGVAVASGFAGSSAPSLGAPSLGAPSLGARPAKLRLSRKHGALAAVLVASMAGGAVLWRARAAAPPDAVEGHATEESFAPHAGSGRSEPQPVARSSSPPPETSSPSALSPPSEVAAPGAPLIRPAATAVAPDGSAAPQGAKPATARGAPAGAHTSAGKRSAGAVAAPGAKTTPDSPPAPASSGATRLPGGVYGEPPYP